MGLLQSITPSWWGNKQPKKGQVEGYKKNLTRYISPVQMNRIRQDFASWREGATEAENAWYPHRVKMQRMYIDTILNGHVEACINKRRNLTLLREYCFKDGENEPEKAQDILDHQWLSLMISYILDAQLFGYSLIALGDITDSEFKNTELIKRWNVSPDRYSVGAFPYSITGVSFMEEPMCDWHIYISTPNEIGTSPCGYGLLYKVAILEIICRNLLGFNTDASELFGMPIRVIKTTKTEESERAELFEAGVNMGSSAVIMMDIGDEIELVERSENGTGYLIYDNLEQRCEKKISKILLGHADAIDSVPGKLGNDGKESPAAQALEEVQTKDGKFVEGVINSQLLPKLRKLGFAIPENLKFAFKNDGERHEIREREDSSNKVTADIAKTMKDAGLQMDAAYFTERTGIPSTPIVEPEPQPTNTNPLSNRIKNKLEDLYK